MSVPHRHLYCRMSHPLRNSPDIYTWNASEEEQTIYDVPVSGGGIPWTVDPPTNLTLTHTSVDFGALASGSGILVSWTPSDDGYVSSTIIQYSPDGGTTWISGGTVPQSTFQSGIAPLSSGTYQVQIAAVRANGAQSEWISASINWS